MEPVGTKTMIKITHRIEGGDKVSSFSHYWEEIAGQTLTAAQLQAVADGMHTGVGELWQEFADQTYRLFATQAVMIKADEYLDCTDGLAPITGSMGVILDGNAQAMGGEIAVVLQRRTGKRGRRYMGRMFVPGLWEGDQASGYLADLSVGKVDALCAYLGTNQQFTPETGPVVDVAARHYTPEKVDSGGIQVWPADFVVVTDVRYVNQLSTRKDRQVKANRVAR
jgi:hypothetical protein